MLCTEASASHRRSRPLLIPFEFISLQNSRRSHHVAIWLKLDGDRKGLREMAYCSNTFFSGEIRKTCKVLNGMRVDPVTGRIWDRIFFSNFLTMRNQHIFHHFSAVDINGRLTQLWTLSPYLNYAGSARYSEYKCNSICTPYVKNQKLHLHWMILGVSVENRLHYWIINWSLNTTLC